MSEIIDLTDEHVVSISTLKVVLTRRNIAYQESETGVIVSKPIIFKDGASINLENKTLLLDSFKITDFTDNNNDYNFYISFNNGSLIIKNPPPEYNNHFLVYGSNSNITFETPDLQKFYTLELPFNTSSPVYRNRHIESFAPREYNDHNQFYSYVRPESFNKNKIDGDDGTFSAIKYKFGDYGKRNIIIKVLKPVDRFANTIRHMPVYSFGSNFFAGNYEEQNKVFLGHVINCGNIEIGNNFGFTFERMHSDKANYAKHGTEVVILNDLVLSRPTYYFNSQSLPVIYNPVNTLSSSEGTAP